MARNGASEKYFESCGLKRGGNGILLEMGSESHCLTNSQFATLFGKRRAPPRKIGCGFFACVYASPDKNKVVKITSDPTDVAAMTRAQGSGAAPVLYRAFELTGGWNSAYAMVLEKLRPLARDARVNRKDKLVAQAVRCSFGPYPDTVAACCRRAGFFGEAPTKRAQTTCLRNMGGIQNALDTLQDRGVKVWDVHPGNIGRDAKGNWKIIDLGATSKADAAPRALQGAQRRRRGR